VEKSPEVLQEPFEAALVLPEKFGNLEGSPPPTFFSQLKASLSRIFP
jgi:hypothetical protein